MNEIARSPRGTNTDEKVIDMLMRYVREERLDAYIQRTHVQDLDAGDQPPHHAGLPARSADPARLEEDLHLPNQVDQPLIY